MKRPISFVLNGDEVKAEVDPHWTLLHLLREQFELTGAKEGCGMGECGSCTVIVNGRTVNSCIFPAVEVEGCEVLTIEGLTDMARTGIHPIQRAFIDHGAIQCGFCTPGMVLSAKHLLDGNPHPSEDEIKQGIAGNICRCTGYVQIIKAIEAAATGGEDGGTD